MKALDLFKGRKITVMTDMKVEVEMTIFSVTEERHSRDVGPSNAENDWWPAQESWITYEVTFTNGVKKTYQRIDDINLIE